MQGYMKLAMFGKAGSKVFGRKTIVVRFCSVFCMFCPKLLKNSLDTYLNSLAWLRKPYGSHGIFRELIQADPARIALTFWKIPQDPRGRLIRSVPNGRRNMLLRDMFFVSFHHEKWSCSLS